MLLALELTRSLVRNPVLLTQCFHALFEKPCTLNQLVFKLLWTLALLRSYYCIFIWSVVLFWAKRFSGISNDGDSSGFVILRSQRSDHYALHSKIHCISWCNHRFMSWLLQISKTAQQLDGVHILDSGDRLHELPDGRIGHVIWQHYNRSRL